MPVKVVCCQLDIAWEDKAANFAAARAMLDAARPAAGALVALPEMFATGFTMNVAAADDGEAGPTREFLAGAARDYGVYMLGGLVAAEGLKGRNECAVFAPDGREVARYCKLHPFTFGGESRHYVPGTGLSAFEWQGFTASPLICYDLRFPEAFRACVRRGANLFAVIANWPSAREQHWVTLLKARAIENQAYVVGVNRCGNDPGLAYPGRSMIVDPRGEVVADAGSGPGTIEAELDLAALEAYRRELPFLADMRADYGAW
jgi:predicted amidohydrolase